jgi:hypothetical protein
LRQCVPTEHSRCAPLVPLRCHSCRVDVLPVAEERPRARHGQLERMAISSLRNAERVRDQSASAVKSLKRAHAAELRSTSACSAPSSAPPTSTVPSTTGTGKCRGCTPATRRTARAGCSWPARTLDHACSMPLGLSQRRDALHADVTAAHRCLQREHAEHVAKLKDIHDASVEGNICQSLARATLTV